MAKRFPRHTALSAAPKGNQPWTMVLSTSTIANKGCDRKFCAAWCPWRCPGKDTKHESRKHRPSLHAITPFHPPPPSTARERVAVRDEKAYFGCFVEGKRSEHVLTTDFQGKLRASATAENTTITIRVAHCAYVRTPGSGECRFWSVLGSEK